MALLEDQQEKLHRESLIAADQKTVTVSRRLLYGIGIVLVVVILLVVLRPSSPVWKVLHRASPKPATTAQQLAQQLQQDPAKVIAQTIEQMQSQVGTGDFSLLAEPPERSTKPGTSLSYKIHLVSSKESPSPVVLRVQGLPSSITAQVSPSTLTADTNIATLTVTIPNTTPFGSYAYTVVGQSTEHVHNLGITTTVTNITAERVGASDVHAMESGTKWQATITWHTDVPANSWVEYTTHVAFVNDRLSYLFSSTNHSSEANHSVTLYFLDADTVYHYRIKSIDALNNIIVSDDGYFVTKK